MSKKLDAIVTEKVMGWPKIGESKSGYFTLHEHPEHGRIQVGPMKPSGNFTRPWSPSTQIESAWEVVEKMRDDGWVVEIETNPTKEVVCKMAKCLNPREGATRWDGPHFCMSTSLPAAASIVSLRAIGVPESEIQEALQ